MNAFLNSIISRLLPIGIYRENTVAKLYDANIDNKKIIILLCGVQYW